MRDDPRSSASTELLRGQWKRGETLFSSLQSNTKRGPVISEVGAGNDVTAGLNFGVPFIKSVKEKDRFTFKETSTISEIPLNQRFTSAKLLYLGRFSGPKKQSGLVVGLLRTRVQKVAVLHLQAVGRLT